MIASAYRKYVRFCGGRDMILIHLCLWICGLETRARAMVHRDARPGPMVALWSSCALKEKSSPHWSAIPSQNGLLLDFRSPGR